MACMCFFMHRGTEFMHKKKLSEAFMFPVCSISKAVIKMHLLYSNLKPWYVLILSFALKTDYHHLVVYINYHTPFGNAND